MHIQMAAQSLVPGFSQPKLNGASAAAKMGMGPMTSEKNFTPSGMGAFGVYGARTSNNFFGQNTDKNSTTLHTNAVMPYNFRNLTLAGDRKHDEPVQGEVLFRLETTPQQRRGPVPGISNMQKAVHLTDACYRTLQQVNRMLRTFRGDYQTAESIHKQFRLACVLSQKMPPNRNLLGQEGYAFAGICGGFVTNAPNLWAQFRLQPGDMIALDLVRVTEPTSKYALGKNVMPGAATAANSKGADGDTMTGSGGSANKKLKADADGTYVNMPTSDADAALDGFVQKLMNQNKRRGTYVSKQMLQADETVQQADALSQAEAYPHYWKFMPQVLSPSCGTDDLPVPSSSVDGWHGYRIVLGTVFKTSNAPQFGDPKSTEALKAILDMPAHSGDLHLNAFAALGSIDFLMSGIGKVYWK